MDKSPQSPDSSLFLAISYVGKKSLAFIVSLTMT